MCCFLPPPMPLFSPLSGVLHGQDASSRQTHGNTCASPAVCPLLLCLFFAGAWLQSSQSSVAWDELTSAFLPHYKMAMNVPTFKKKKKVVLCLLEKPSEGRKILWYFFGIWRQWPQPQGLNCLNHTHWGVRQQTRISCCSLCVHVCLCFRFPVFITFSPFD